MVSMVPVSAVMVFFEDVLSVLKMIISKKVSLFRPPSKMVWLGSASIKYPESNSKSGLFRLKSADNNRAL